MPPYQALPTLTPDSQPRNTSAKHRTFNTRPTYSLLPLSGGRIHIPNHVGRVVGALLGNRGAEIPSQRLPSCSLPLNHCHSCASRHRRSRFSLLYTCYSLRLHLDAPTRRVILAFIDFTAEMTSANTGCSIGTWSGTQRHAMLPG